MAKENNAEIVQNFKISDDALAEISSFDDAANLLRELYGESGVLVASEVMGDGFAMVSNKDLLLGVGFIIISWSITMGDHGEFVAAKIVTVDNKKLILTDGSTGIHQQLSDYSAKSGRYGGMYVKNGLRKSDYTYTDETGAEKPATTYYLDLSA